ncbi:MAG: site-specific integrase [Actinomycetota bacterium]|nr:site-specific integrase [Actinomycetota bacterium]
MPKRGNGEGSISKRSGGGWMAQYYVLSGTGGRERRTLYAKTRTEAARKLARAIGERDTGFVVDAGRLTMGDYLERWLEDSVKGTVRTSTYEAYRYMVEPHLVPFLGALKLRDINPVHVRALYREKLEAGLSAATVRKMHAVLSKAMKQAVMDGLVHRNVCDSVRPPRLARKEIRPLDPEQAGALLRAAASDRLEALYVLAVHTGMREGELLGLKWEDVSLDGEEPVLRLRRALVREAGKVALGELKTPKSRRQVRLTRAAAGALRAHLARQMEEIERAGPSYRAGGLVFATESGSPINPSNLRNRSFKPLLRRAGLAGICFHDLRHTCATLLLTRNVHPKLVQELLGHATISMTLDTYSHFLPSMGDQTVRAMEAALGSAP